MLRVGGAAFDTQAAVFAPFLWLLFHPYLRASGCSCCFLLRFCLYCCDFMSRLWEQNHRVKDLACKQVVGLVAVGTHGTD